MKQVYNILKVFLGMFTSWSHVFFFFAAVKKKKDLSCTAKILKFKMKTNKVRTMFK